MRARSGATAASARWKSAALAAVRHTTWPWDEYGLQSLVALSARRIATCLAAPLGTVLLQHVLSEVCTGLLALAPDAGNFV